MIEVTLLIPVADDAGLAFDPAHGAPFESHLAAAFGGYTRLPGLAVGG